MKSIVTDHAIAINKPIMVDSSLGKCEMQVYECGCGGLIAIDTAFLEANDGEELYINSPWDDGKSIQLVDSLTEINKSTVCGDDHEESVIDNTLEKIKEDIANGDVTSLAEMLNFLSTEVLNNYLCVN